MHSVPILIKANIQTRFPHGSTTFRYKAQRKLIYFLWKSVNNRYGTNIKLLLALVFVTDQFIYNTAATLRLRRHGTYL